MKAMKRKVQNQKIIKIIVSMILCSGILWQISTRESLAVEGSNEETVMNQTKQENEVQNNTGNISQQEKKENRTRTAEMKKTIQMQKKQKIR